MKLKLIVALLFLLCVMCGLQISCSAHAIKIDKVIIEYQVDRVSDRRLIH